MLGRRIRDIGLMVDFHRKRAIVRANTAWIDGTELEIIPSGPNDYAPAMVLIHRDWDDIYFLIERNGWVDEEYFAYARKRFDELNIKKP